MPQAISLGKTAKIVGMHPATFRTIRARYYRVFPKEFYSEPPGEGLAASVTHRGVIYMAIFARLAAYGLSPPACASAAKQFDGSLFPVGRTILLVHATPGGRGSVHSWVINQMPGETLDEALRRSTWPKDAALIIDLGEVVRHVEVSLRQC